MRNVYHFSHRALMLLALVVSVSFLASSCGQQSVAGFAIDIKTTNVGIPWDPAMPEQDIRVTCPSGEPVIGGGYRFDYNSGVPGDDPVVLINRPSPTGSAWDVAVLRSPTYSPTYGYVYAYCLKSSTQVTVVRVADSETLVDSPTDEGVTETAKVMCPAGSTLLSGGFLTTFDDPLGNNAGVLSSLPHFAASGQADGWSAVFAAPPPLTPSVSVEVDALCATTVLLPAPAVNSPFVPSSSQGSAATSPVCGTHQLSAGGGYQWQAPPPKSPAQVPTLTQTAKSVFESAANPGPTWYVGGTYDDSLARQDSQNSWAILSLSAWVVCFTVPTP
jgi:hypothetical protein